MKKYCLIMFILDIFCLLLIFTVNIKENIKYNHKTTEIMQNSASKTTEMPQTEDEESKRIAITFDDGPDPVYTPMLLDGLKERDVKATFFVLGKKIDGNEDIIKRMKEEGHIIGNHTFSHVQLTALSKDKACEEIMQTCERLYEVLGEYPQYIRPPFGSWDKSLECEIDMFPVAWTIDPLDWTTSNIQSVVNKVVKKAKDNGIILLHDNYKSSIKAAFQIIDILQEQGYEFVTVEELILE